MTEGKLTTAIFINYIEKHNNFIKHTCIFLFVKTNTIEIINIIIMKIIGNNFN